MQGWRTDKLVENFELYLSKKCQVYSCVPLRTTDVPIVEYPLFFSLV